MFKRKAILIVMSILFVAVPVANSFTVNAYTVKPGESWYSIAEEFGISPRNLANYNGKTLDCIIKIGEEVEIPTNSSGTGNNEYVVKPNDSWYKIAQQFGISAKDLAIYNGRTLDCIIKVGETLKIPTNSSGTNNNEYVVKPNDSWYKIAQQFGVSAKNLAIYNGRTLDCIIKVGETLKIPTNSSGTSDLSSKSETASNSGEIYLSSITLKNVPSGNSWYNIKLAASQLNGLKLKPGESFSWASYMGACGKEQGYLKAGVYSNGRVATDYGGGVCFVSTCLMQAARAAGLQINERHDHSRPVSYASRGDEASVSYGSWDLKFTNTTNSTVVFYVYTSAEGYCTVTCVA